MKDFRAVPGSRGILRSHVVDATVESFPLFRCPGCRVTGVLDAE